jgi:hypothetical protein
MRFSGGESNFSGLRQFLQRLRTGRSAGEVWHAGSSSALGPRQPAIFAAHGIYLANDTCQSNPRFVRKTLACYSRVTLFEHHELRFGRLSHPGSDSAEPWNKEARMPVDKNYRVVLGEAREQVAPAGERGGAAPADLKPSRQRVLTALKETSGAEEFIQKIPNLETLDLWQDTAYFSVCSKTGTAIWLDLWDADHFDYYTDMQTSLNECRVWFSADGRSEYGSPETKTGVINCTFSAPTDGFYICTASLQGDPSGGQAQVECLVDNFSFGSLPFTGTIHQPHLANLSQGSHYFRIRQESGEFFFLSLSVWALAVNAPT